MIQKKSNLKETKEGVCESSLSLFFSSFLKYTVLYWVKAKQARGSDFRILFLFFFLLKVFPYWKCSGWFI